MDYKEKYLKGLEEAKKTLDSLDENYRCHELTKDDIRVIYSRLFPELTESEDERIRRILYESFDKASCSKVDELVNCRLTSAEILSYLEKQKEQKPNLSEKDSTDFEIEVHEIIAQARNDSRLNDADVLKQFEEEAAFALMLKANKLIEQKPVDIKIDNPNTQNIIKSFVDSMSPDESLTGIEHDLALYAQLLAHYKAIKSDVQYNNALKGFAIAVKESLKEPQAVDISANFERAEKEKKDFVTGGFIKCIKKVNGFNEGESYWLEYIGDDRYVGRSDNVLNSTFNITPKELFTHFRRLCEYDENGDLILSGFESALFSAFSDAWQSYLKGEDVNVAQWAKEHSEELSKIALIGRVWKIMPIFNVGDFIKKKGENYVPWKITEVNEEGGYYCGNYQHGYPTELMFRDQRDYERVDNPGMEAPKINGKPISTENNVVNISYWMPSEDQLEAVRYLLEDYRPWLLSASEARKELATIYDEMLKLAKK